MEGHMACFKFMIGEAKSSAHVLGARNNNGDTPKLLAVQFYRKAVVEYITTMEWELEHPEESKSEEPIIFSVWMEEVTMGLHNSM